MNKIVLDAEHMAKIFDMCNYFFPDLTVAGAVIVDGIFVFRDLENSGKFIRMHWMELCITHLSHKIVFNPKKPLHFCQDTHFRMLDQLMKLFWGQDKFVHPVDFLHSEYLKQHN